MQAQQATEHVDMNGNPIEPGRYDLSLQLFHRAQQFIPGGVNSPVRAFGKVGGTPVFMAGAEGAVLQDMDGNQYVDYVGSWGPMILGHANKRVIQAIQKAAEHSTSFGAPTDLETCLADFIVTRHKAVEMVRLVNSGTEASMSALRLARGYTGKDRIVKCVGGYHGHADSLLVAAGSGLATQGVPDSLGVPKAVAELTTTVPYNDLEAVKEVFEKFDDIAAIIIEPVAGNMGCIPPVEGYLEGIRELCTFNEVVFIMDEVMTGFRLHEGSAQTRFDIEPDLSCFGKIIGGGMPLAAYAGKADIMNCVAPVGGVYQAGTLSGNPLAVSAGIEMLEQLTPNVYTKLEEMSAEIADGLSDILKQHNVTHAMNRVGSMFSIFFREGAPKNYEEVCASDSDKFRKFFHGMLEEGVYLPPSPYEACFISAVHAPELIRHTLQSAEKVAKTL